MEGVLTTLPYLPWPHGTKYRHRVDRRPPGIPSTGCDKISPGCTHCYAEPYVAPAASPGVGQPNYRNGFDLTLHRHAPRPAAALEKAA